MKTSISIDTEPKRSGTEIANHYGVDVATVRRWRREGMPAIWYNAKLVRYELSAVDAWLRVKGSQPRPVIVPPHERKKANATPSGDAVRARQAISESKGK